MNVKFPAEKNYSDRKTRSRVRHCYKFEKKMLRMQRSRDAVTARRQVLEKIKKPERVV